MAATLLGLNVLFLNDTPFVRFGLASGFTALGHEVSYLRPHLWERAPDAQVSAAETWIANEPPADIVIYEGLTGGRAISPQAIRCFRRSWGSLFFYWAIEDPIWSHEVLARDGRPGPYISVSDHVFTTASECAQRYREAGYASSVLLFACNPAFHRSESVDQGLASDVCLVANNYSTRPRRQFGDVIWPAVELCARRGLTCRVYGRWWEETPASRFACGRLEYESLPRVYGATKVALGLEQCLDMSATQSSVRIFEALACGACYLGPAHRAHAALFQAGEEALFSGSAAETEELLEWILDDDAARLAIAVRGRERCLREHTYAARAAEMLAVYRTITRRGDPPV
jgi:spore maturation protein CgeB